MALKAGAIRFNTDSGRLKIYDGSQWTEISASSTEQLTGGTRGVFGGSNNVMDYVQIPTTGDAIDFGDLSETFFINKALGGRIRGIFAGDRPSTNKIIWKGTGPFFHQHDVNILDEHRISIFNNNSKNFADGEYVDGNNEVIIYDFKTDKYSLYLNDALAGNEVRTVTQGRSKILPNGDLFVEESNYARTLYFNSDGSLRWTHVNRADNGNLYVLGWSRILYTDDDIKIVKNFIENRGTCNE